MSATERNLGLDFDSRRLNEWFQGLRDWGNVLEVDPHLGNQAGCILGNRTRGTLLAHIQTSMRDEELLELLEFGTLSACYTDGCVDDCLHLG